MTCPAWRVTLPEPGRLMGLSSYQLPKVDSAAIIMVHFKTPSGVQVPCVDLSSWQSLVTDLENRYSISRLQIVEAAAFSMAMVVRFALGLEAQEGQVLVLAGPGLSGQIAAATLRHLINGGANGFIVILDEPQDDAPLLQQLKPLDAMQVPIYLLKTALEQGMEGLLSQSHNVICGLFDADTQGGSVDAALIEVLNDTPTPIHAIHAPLGIDVDTGKHGASPMYASSTLSLGLPLSAALLAQELFGRQYCCDISFPAQLLAERGIICSGLFSEQPVVKLLPESEPA